MAELKDYGGDFIGELYDTALNKYNPLALAYHYRSIGKNNFYKYVVRGNDVSYKRYLYAFRGLFNAMWVVFNKSLPPANFEDAVRLSNFLPASVKEIALYIIQRKREGSDKEQVGHNFIMDEYLHEQFELFEIPNDLNHRVILSKEFNDGLVKEVMK